MTTDEPSVLERYHQRVENDEFFHAGLIVAILGALALGIPIGMSASDFASGLFFGVVTVIVTFPLLALAQWYLLKDWVQARRVARQRVHEAEVEADARRHRQAHAARQAEAQRTRDAMLRRAEAAQREQMEKNRRANLQRHRALRIESFPQRIDTLISAHTRRYEMALAGIRAAPAQLERSVSEAEAAVSAARGHLEAPRYSPFWESAERAARSLQDYDAVAAQLDGQLREAGSTYEAMASGRAVVARLAKPDFAVHVVVGGEEFGEPLQSFDALRSARASFDMAGQPAAPAEYASGLDRAAVLRAASEGVAALETACSQHVGQLRLPRASRAENVARELARLMDRAFGQATFSTIYEQRRTTDAVRSTMQTLIHRLDHHEAEARRRNDAVQQGVKALAKQQSAKHT